MSAVKTTCSAGEKRKVAFIRDSVNDAIGQPVPSPDDWVCWRGRARSERNRGVVNRWQREFLTALRGGPERETHQTYASNGELPTLDTIGARIAPSAEIEN
jgi:hypothetical protein